MNKLFLYFQITQKMSGKYKKVKLNEINHLVYYDEKNFKLIVNKIDELGPRPLTFPISLKITRYNDELKFLYHILHTIRSTDIIFSEKAKLRQFYLKLKKMGIRDSYIPSKLRNLNIRGIALNKDLLYIEDIKLLEGMEKTGNFSNHWDVLHYLYSKTKIMSQLISNNGFKLKEGIFEIKIKNDPKTTFKRKRGRKKGLWRYLDGM